MFYALFRMSFPAGWDEAFYMSQASSAILDHDLMLQNDVLMFGNPIDERIRAVKLLNKEGYHLNAFSIGPALFYSIPLLPVYQFDDQRFGLSFQGGIALWVALFWFFGFAALYQILKLIGVSMNTRYLALIASVFSTPFLLYGTRFYFTAHFLSAILVIFCLYFWIRWFQTSDYIFAWAMGLASGFLVITRWESGLFFVSFLWPLFLAFRTDSDKRKRFYGLMIGVLTGVLVRFLLGYFLFLWLFCLLRFFLFGPFSYLFFRCHTGISFIFLSFTCTD